MNVTDLRDDRHVRGIVLNARDVTERNLADAERERLLEHEKLANERLRELDRLKDEFVALVSHEARTPLTSIRGYLELLSDEQLTPEQRKFTNIIGRNSDRLLRLINVAGAESETVWIEVRDTGIGINEVDQERLFNKFFRTRAATKSSIQGTGLGLAISKAIVQAHGGSIQVESGEGRGSTFRVELPIYDRARLDEPQRSTTA